VGWLRCAFVLIYSGYSVGRCVIRSLSVHSDPYPAEPTARVAVVHDYLTQLGGAERVVLLMLKAFPGAPVHTSLYDPVMTFPEFCSLDVRPLAVNRIQSLRTHHRRALPVLAPSFSRLRLDHDVVICSSSGWAHGVQASGRKIVYCHSPARWLYQPDRYLGPERSLRASARRAALWALRGQLEKWDRRASASADVFLANSTMVQRAVRDLYGREAEVLAPPSALDPNGGRDPSPGLDPGFLLCVSRLLPYKNVDAIIEAFRGRPELLVIVGAGPDRERLAETAPSNVRFLGSVTDEHLRWLYANCRALISASYEDYGLTPLEAAAFGRPAVVLRWGGFLDNVVEGETGLFFEAPTPAEISRALDDFLALDWSVGPILALAERRSEAKFSARLREIVGVEDRVIRLPDVDEKPDRVIRLPDSASPVAR
jgi:glycosyltransferase involved in cell wall biosynthesis